MNENQDRERTDQILDAYIECALWSTLDHYEVDESGNNPTLDERYGPEDISDETRERMRSDCEAFWRDNEADLTLYMDRLGYGPEQAGHDFWLTREHHGAGFWDRYYGSDVQLTHAIKQLTRAAEDYGAFSDELNEGINR